MGHELDITDGQASFASAQIDAWHRLGQVLPGLMTAQQALDAAHLAGWNVRKVPLWVDGDPVITDDGVAPGERIKVKGKWATVRTNPIDGGTNVLGVVGDQYTAIQNEEHADLLNTLVDESGAHFETAGALFEGRQTFLSMKLPRTIELRGSQGVDRTELYLVALNSHDGSSAFRLLVTPIRVVCANTQAAALNRRVSSFSVRHTVNAAQHIQVAREALGMTWAYVDAFEQELERLIHQEKTNAEAEKILRKAFRFDQQTGTMTDRMEKNQAERIDEVIKLWQSSPTLDGFHGSSFGLYQAVTEWADHYSPVTKEGQAGYRQRAERIVKGGDMQRLKMDTFTMLTAV